METDERARESRLRSLARRQGYALRKDRARSSNIDHHGGWMIVDVDRNWIVAGPRWDLDLDEAEAWLTDRPQPTGVR